MRNFANICLILVAAAAFTGCGRKQFVNGGCCASGGCATGGCATACCDSGRGGRAIGQTGRMYGQNADPADYCQACGGGGRGGRGGACDACGGSGRCGNFHLASGWRNGMCNDDYKQTQPPFGPQGAQVAYPYYTTRGPRDFLVDNPPSIGN